mgnify:CR=1 FL=1
MRDEVMNFMGHLWIQVEDNAVLVGLNEEAVNEIDKITALNLPTEGEEVEADDVIGEIETPDGDYKLYAPVTGSVVEVNPDVAEDTSLLFDDPAGSWIFKIEASNEDELDKLFEDKNND